MLTYTATGFVNGDDQTVLTGALARAAGVAKGTYPITQGTLSAANYTISYTGADFIITDAPGDFVTVWDTSKPGHPAYPDKLRFEITTLPSPNNQVRYFWTTSEVLAAVVPSPQGKL